MERIVIMDFNSGSVYIYSYDTSKYTSPEEFIQELKDKDIQCFNLDEISYMKTSNLYMEFNEC